MVSRFLTFLRGTSRTNDLVTMQLLILLLLLLLLEDHWETSTVNTVSRVLGKVTTVTTQLSAAALGSR